MDNEHQNSPLWIQEDWKREFVEIFFARRGVIFTTAVLIFIATGWIAIFWPPTYEATSSILLRGKKPQLTPAMLEKAVISAPEITREDLSSEMEILVSPELIRRALVRKYGSEQAVENELTADDFPFQENGNLANAISHIRNNLHTEIIPYSNVVSITYQDKDAGRAERILDVLLREYLGYRAQVFSPSEEADFLEERADYYLRQLHEKEEEILALAKRGNVSLIQREMENNDVIRKQLSLQLAETKVEHGRQLKTLESLNNALERDSVQMFSFLNNDSMNRLGGQLALLIEKREDSARHFLPETPMITGMDQQIDRIYKLLRTEAKQILEDRGNTVESLEISIEKLEEQIQEISARNIVLQTSLFEKMRLDRDIRMLENSYETYTRRSEESRISSAIAAANISGEVTILAKADLSASRAFPKPMQTLLAGVLAGVVAGLSLGFLTEYLDHTIKRPGDVHRYLGLPVLCSIKKTR